VENVTKVPHRLNVVGDFYVTDGCCTACGVPEANAPNLFAYDPERHCYVCRQPVTPSELDGMVAAMAQQELGCIRYRGMDAAVMKALLERGEGSQVDRLHEQRHLHVESSRGRVQHPVLSWLAKIVRWTTGL